MFLTNDQNFRYVFVKILLHYKTDFEACPYDAVIVA